MERVARRGAMIRALAGVVLAVLPALAAVEVVGPGAPRVVSIAAGADAGVRYAAEELCEHLGIATGADWRVVEGETAARLHVEADFALDAEAHGWRVRDGRLHLVGGSPRGPLYAVHRFLRERVGVRWWTPWDRHVPRVDGLVVSGDRGPLRPRFAMRDLFDGLHDPAFAARSGLNGHHARLSPALEPDWRFGTPGYTHTFFKWFPPDPVFERHPEWYSWIDGRRTADGGQLCLTNAALREHWAERLLAAVDEDRRRAERDGVPPPRLYSVTANDWGGACRCAPCSAATRRHGARSGPLLEVVNALADAVAERHPRVRIETLAYAHTADVPTGIRARPNVVLRHATLKRRDFARSLAHPRNRAQRRQLDDWLERADTVWVWDYAVHYGPHGDMPLERLRRVFDDLATYERREIEGVFYQHDDPLADDLRDLSRWLLGRWLFEPRARFGPLVREFTDGFYGPAGDEVRRYLALQRRARRRQDAPIRYLDPPGRFTAIDVPFLHRAARLWDAAEAEVAGDPRRLERVRHGRLTLDRAILVRWREAPRDLAGRKVWPEGLDAEAVAARYRATWEREIARRLPPGQRAAAVAEVEREIAWLTGLSSRGASVDSRRE